MRFQKIIHVVLGLGGALAIGQIVRAAATFFPHCADIINYVIVPAMLFGTLVCVLQSLEASWKGPAKELTEKLRKIRAGELAMEELGDVNGGLKPLAVLTAELLHDVRAERKRLGELEHEMRQRIAHRTEALERMIGSLRQQATRDALTGLFNRRMLDQHLPELIQTCRSSSQDLCVLTIDVDNFKLLNDTLGHGEGDALLRSIGQLIRSAVRQSDAAFRCGGDEFLIVLPSTDHDAAQALADRLVSLVDGLTQTLKLKPRPGLSIGQARLSEVPDATPEALLAEADRSLYEQKSIRKREQRHLANARVFSAP
jgi:diguanylate cyclase (GGDEF)-like protein